MTVCSRPLSDLQDSAIEADSIENGQHSNLRETEMREDIKSSVKDRTVADAVQAKAGVGIFAPGASSKN
jgi:hypothetical protein